MIPASPWIGSSNTATVLSSIAASIAVGIAIGHST